MSNRLLACATVLFATVSTAALAENWVQIIKNDHSNGYVDTDSGERSGAHVKFWIRYLFDAPHPIGIYDGKQISGPNLKGTTHFVESRSLVDVDCAKNTFTNPLVKFYDAAGTMVSSGIASEESKDMPPNSIVKAGAELLCPKS